MNVSYFLKVSSTSAAAESEVAASQYGNDREEE
jgi:hypothetical protein